MGNGLFMGYGQRGGTGGDRFQHSAGLREVKCLSLLVYLVPLCRGQWVSVGAVA